MTDHLFGSEGEEKEAGGDSSIAKTDDPPPSLHPHKINSIPSLREGTTKQSVDLQSNILCVLRDFFANFA